MHLGYEVDRAIRVVTSAFLQQAVLFFQPLMQRRAVKRVEQADHRGDDSAGLYEPYLAFEDRDRVAVKADNETTLHLKTVALYFLYAGNQVPVRVLAFTAFGQAYFIRRFDAHEDSVKAGLRH